MIYNYEGFLDWIIDSKASKIAMNTVKRKKGAEKYVRRWKVPEALLRPSAFFQHVRLCDLHSVKKTQDGVNREGRRGRGRRGLESSGRGRSWPPAPPRPGSSAPRPLVTHASGRVPGQTEGVRGETGATDGRRPHSPPPGLEQTRVDGGRPPRTPRSPLSRNRVSGSEPFSARSFAHGRRPDFFHSYGRDY